MDRTKRAIVAALVLTVIVAGCTAPGAPAGGPAATGAQPSGAPKRITAVSLKGDPLVVLEKLEGAADTLQELLVGGLGMLDTQGIVHAEYAEAVPTVENGLWKVFPDGRMETTWKIREGARWQDGTAFTTDDLLFTIQVSQDPTMPFGDPAFRSVEAVEALDARTITVRWRGPFVLADRMFTRFTALPLPKHLLENVYAEASAAGAPAAFVEQRYWSDDYVGLGPFKIRGWERGSHMELEANGLYILGRPKLDGVQVRFITDVNTVVATVLASGADVTLGSGLEAEQAVQLRDNWKDGSVSIQDAAFSALIPQFINPSPAVVGNPEFRRALLQALNRQEMAETIRLGVVSIAHGYLSRELPELQQLEARLVKYPYDPNRAAQIIEGLGYRKGPDGMFRDSGNQQLSLEVRSGSRGDEPNTLQAVADYWKRVGVDVQTVVTTGREEREYTATFPAFLIRRYTDDPNRVTEFSSTEAPLPGNNFRGRNPSRYRSPELDGLLNRFSTTIPRGERMQVFGDIIHHLSDQVVLLPIFYNVGVTVISNRMKSVTPRTSTTQAWKSYEWDLG